MKRESSLRTAAAPTAAVLETKTGANSQIMKAPEPSGSSPAIKKPVEVDLGAPGAAVYWEDPRVELFVRLEELYPGDPGQLSGAALRISESGPCAELRAETGDIPDGSRGLHCLGYLTAEEVEDFARKFHRGGAFMVSLREPYPHATPDAFSGAELTFAGDLQPEIRLGFGRHCLGVLREPLLSVFLRCARVRSAAFTRM
jgi:hypothetical protein